MTEFILLSGGCEKRDTVLIKMRTIWDFVELALVQEEITLSKLAIKIGVSKQRLHTLKYRDDGNLPADSVLILANILNIDPIIIYASMMFHQSEKLTTKEYWKNLPSRLVVARFGNVHVA